MILLISENLSISTLNCVFFKIKIQPCYFDVKGEVKCVILLSYIDKSVFLWLKEQLYKHGYFCRAKDFNFKVNYTKCLLEGWFSGNFRNEITRWVNQ